MIMDEFLLWSEIVKPEIEHVSKILSEKLSDEPEELIDALNTVEVWNSRVGSLHAQADSWLDRAKFHLMPSRAEGKLEADRKAELDNEVAPIRLLRDTLESLSDAIRTRITLGQSLLSYRRILIENRIMQPQRKVV